MVHACGSKAEARSRNLEFKGLGKGPLTCQGSSTRALDMRGVKKPPQQAAAQHQLGSTILNSSEAYLGCVVEIRFSGPISNFRKYNFHFLQMGQPLPIFTPLLFLLKMI